MPFASWHGALRSAGRKAANALRSNHSNGGSHLEGGGTTGTRALHSTAVRAAHPAPHADIIHKLTTTLDQIRPRNPAHRLFSSTNGFLANIFTKLAAPGYKVPLGSYIHQTYASTATNAGRTLLQARPITIPSGLSPHARFAIRNHKLGAGTFLPRAPSVPIRGPIASQVGLGTARNFSSTRPLFQNLVENVPIALRALYEADLDELKGTPTRKTLRRIPVAYKVSHSARVSKLKARTTKPSPKVAEETSVDSTELERYFTAPVVPAVTTQLIIPLAPTPTNRVPLWALDNYLQDLPSSEYGTPPGPAASNGRFIPLRDIGEVHGSYSNHALRVSTIFARLDQANVWSSGGVVCSAYSGPGAGAIGRRESPVDDTKSGSGGVCTILKVEFHGWTAAEVRGVIGESGRGWCVLEEVWHGEDEDDRGLLSAAEDEEDSLSSVSGLSSPACFASPPSLPVDAIGLPAIDPAQSFVLPTLDFSSSFLYSASERSEPRQTTTDALDLEYDDPWMDVENEGSTSDGYVSAGSMSPISLSRSSSTSSFEDVIPAVKRPLSQIPASEASSWSRFEFSSRFYEAASTRDGTEPREMMF